MPENNKKSFIMYSNYRKFLSKLPDKDIADLIKAIFCFVEGEEVPELSPSAELCFGIISDQIKRDMEKYEKVCERRAIAGRLGGIKTQEKRKMEEEKEEEKDIQANARENGSKTKQMLENSEANASKTKQMVADNDIAIDKDIYINNKYISEKKKTYKRKRKNYATEFECFWEVYPRKADKGEAYKKYLTRLNDGWSPEQLLTAAKKYKAQIIANRTDQKYIKLCKTFLSDTTPFADYLTKTERQGVSNDAENPYAEWKEGANG